MAETQQLHKGKEMNEIKEGDIIVRIMGHDIPGSKNIYTGLTRIKGISWSISNAVCYKLKFDKYKKISDLTKDEIKNIEEFMEKFEISNFLKNRRADHETGETSHYLGSDLDMKKEFDIKRLIKMKSYRGLRHSLKQPVRGQRTRSHFRKKGQAVGVKRRKDVKNK